jgi:hypothetical protein
MAADPPELLRPGVLAGLGVVLAATDAPPPASPAGALRDAALALGASVASVAVSAAGAPEQAEAAAESALASALSEIDGPLGALVVDAGALFEAEGMVAALAASWNAVRAAAQLAFLRDGQGGKIVLLAPADAASAAGLENLARTLSIEWARHRIRTTAIAPAASTRAADLAALCCWLLSPAGDYFSGCLMDLRGPGVGS